VSKDGLTLAGDRCAGEISAHTNLVSVSPDMHTRIPGDDKPLSIKTFLFAVGDSQTISDGKLRLSSMRRQLIGLEVNEQVSATFVRRDSVFRHLG